MENESEKKQWNFLKSVFLNNRIPQAIIFSGPDFLDKKKIVLEFIKLLNCENAGEKGCGKCFNCKLTEQNRHPDLIFLEASSGGRKEIQIDEVRRLQKKMMLRPSVSRFKSAIINQAEHLNIQSQNSLLKILEEPSGSSFLALITSSQDSLIETIRSRCEKLRFYPSDFHFSGSDYFKEAEKILESDLGKRLLFCQNFLGKDEEGGKINLFLEGFENYLRALILKKIGIEKENSFNSGFKFPENYSLIKMIKAVEIVEEFRNILKSTNANPKLALENLMIEI